MARPVKKRSHKSGLSPGTAVYVGERKAEEVKINVIDYDEQKIEIKELDTVEACFPYKEKESISWINVCGLHEVAIIEKLGGFFNIHPLVLEDVLNTEQRTKMDVFDDHIFIVIKMHSYDPEKRQVISEQVSVLFGKNYVVTFQEKEGDIFDPVRNRIKSAKGRIRKAGADYLAYALIDAIVDNYFKVLEGIGEEIENIENDVVGNPVPSTLQNVHILKRETIYLRKSVWPLREIISILEREDSPLIKKSTKIYLRDLYDHTIQVIDTVETYRDIISGVLDVYLSSVSNKMNEIMKVLTIFAALFIPLTFIAGIYGMNFNPDKSPLNMPELNWYFGYPLALGLMTVIAVVLLLFFKRKNWM